MRLDRLKQLIETGSSKGNLLEELEMVQFENFGVNWTLDDIIGIYKDNEKECSREKAREIADIAERRHDANIGINWEYLNCIIDNYESSIIKEDAFDYEPQGYSEGTDGELNHFDSDSGL